MIRNFVLAFAIALTVTSAAYANALSVVCGFENGSDAGIHMEIYDVTAEHLRGVADIYSNGYVTSYSGKNVVYSETRDMAGTEYFHLYTLFIGPVYDYDSGYVEIAISASTGFTQVKAVVPYQSPLVFNCK